MSIPISELLQQRPQSTNSYSNSNGGLYNKPTIAIAIAMDAKEEDQLITWAGDLITENYRLWFIKRLRSIGKQRFIDAANSARKYDDKTRRQKVFAYLVK